ncbi:MAG: lysoplasmalogenase [Flavobacteriales bacterium]
MDIRKNTLVNAAAFAAAALGTIIGNVSGSSVLVFICKPLLMIILSSWFYFKSRRVGDRFTLLIQAGLFFSLVGDVALMAQEQDEFFFLIGLGSFLIAQLCYAMAFAHNVANTSGPVSFVPGLIAVGIIAYGFLFAMDLVPRVDEHITLPVSIYAIAICLMGVAAAFRYHRTYPRSFWMVFVGACLFILSDSLLAYDRFIFPLIHAKWSVILTYAAAQYLIITGCLVHVLDPAEIRRKAALNT